MPPKGKKLTLDEVHLLERWIALGAPTARPEPDSVPKVYITEEDREFWAFKPLKRPTPMSLTDNKGGSVVSELLV